MCFRLAPRSITLDDRDPQYLRIIGEFREISQIWEATTTKRYCHEDRPEMSATAL